MSWKKSNKLNSDHPWTYSALNLHAKAMARLMQWFLQWIESAIGCCLFTTADAPFASLVMADAPSQACARQFLISVLYVFSISKMWEPMILPVGLPSMWVDEIKTSLIVGSSFRLFKYLMQRSKIYLLENLSVTSSAIMEYLHSLNIFLISVLFDSAMQLIFSFCIFHDVTWVFLDPASRWSFRIGSIKAKVLTTTRKMPSLENKSLELTTHWQILLWTKINSLDN